MIKMRTIETRFHKATEDKIARYSARTIDGHKIFMPKAYSKSPEENHEIVCRLLCAEHGWQGTMVAGLTRHGYMFTFLEFFSTKTARSSKYIPITIESNV